MPPDSSRSVVFLVMGIIFATLAMACLVGGFSDAFTAGDMEFTPVAHAAARVQLDHYANLKFALFLLIEFVSAVALTLWTRGRGRMRNRDWPMWRNALSGVGLAVLFTFGPALILLFSLLLIVKKI